MANEIAFDLNNKEAENLWALISGAQMAKLDPSASVPFALYELRKTLDELRKVPDDEDTIRPQAQMEYCKANDLSRAYYPMAGTIQWEFERRLLPILKLVLKHYVTTTDGAGVATLLKLCITLRLNGWFLKNFKKPLSIDLGEDDCDLDDELDDDQEGADALAEAAADAVESVLDELDEAIAAD